MGKVHFSSVVCMRKFRDEFLQGPDCIVDDIEFIVHYKLEVFEPLYNIHGYQHPLASDHEYTPWKDMQLADRIDKIRNSDRLQEHGR